MKKFKKLLLVITTLLGFAPGALSQIAVVEIYNTPGSYIWTVPCGVNLVTVGVYGAGGGGGGSNTNSIGGGGGGSGAYVENTYFVIPGNTYAIDVGAGGIGSPTAAGNGGNGQQSTFNGNLTAGGGFGGLSENLGGTGGAGGTVSILWPPVIINGNPGNNGTAVSGGYGGTHPGPYGGAGAPGGAPGAPGGIGNPQGAGGGGGGMKLGSANTLGGAGANGAIILSYNTTVTQAEAGPNQNTCNAIYMMGSTPDPGWTGTWAVTSGTAIINAPNDPNTLVTIPAPGSCATLTWTFSSPGCVDLVDSVTICYPLICNDDPCGAIGLPVGPSCSYQTYTNVGATASSGMVEPGCGDWGGNDVWYVDTVPANGIVTVNLTDAVGGPIMNMGLAFYTGPDCFNLSHNGCDFADPGTPGDIAELTYAGTPGELLYIRVWDADEQEDAYQICSFSPAVTTGDINPGPNTVTCGVPMTFMDPGGTGSYQNLTGSSYVLCPDTPGQYVTVDFSTAPNFFDLDGSGGDYLTILDGNYDSSAVIGQWTGTTGPGIITSGMPDGCLTIIFQTDEENVDLGWLASVSCSSTPGVNDTLCSSTNCSGGCGTWICQTGLYPTTNNGNGVADLAINTSGCFGATGEIASQWFYFTAQTTGTVEFTFAGPNGQDYNLAIWGPSTNGIPPCPMNTGQAPILCSQADVQNTGNPVGISQALGGGESYEGPEGDGWIQQLNVVAGETYAMIMNIFQNGNPQPIIDLTIGGTGQLDCTPVFLPIELHSFVGIHKGTYNVLNWITNSELNNDYFTIERSVNGFDWEVVGHVDGMGTTQHARYYELEDHDIYLPVTYYRLSQTDFDGKTTYHNVIALNGDKELEGDLVSNVFPNPSSTYATFTYNGTDTNTPLNVVVLNEMGEQIINYDYVNLYPGMPSTLRTEDLAAGLYQVIFTQGENRDVQKLAIIH